MSNVGDFDTVISNIETSIKNRNISVHQKILTELEREEAKQCAKEIAETKAEIVSRSLPSIQPKNNWIVPIGLKERAPNLPINQKEALDIGANFFGKEQEKTRQNSQEKSSSRTSDLSPGYSQSFNSRSPLTLIAYDEVKIEKFHSLDRYEIDTEGKPIKIGGLNVGLNANIRPIEVGFKSLQKNDRVTVSIEGVKESRKALENLPLVDSLVMYNDGVAVSFVRHKGQSLEFIGKQAIIDRKATKVILTLVKGRNANERIKFPNGLTITCEPKISPIQVGINAIVPPTSQQVEFLDRTAKKIKNDKIAVFLSLPTGLVKCGQYESCSEALRVAGNALRETGESGYVLFSSMISLDGNEIDSGINLSKEKAFLNEDGSLKSIFVQKGNFLTLMRTSVIANEELANEPIPKKGPVMYVNKGTSSYVHGKKRGYSKSPWMRGA